MVALRLTGLSADEQTLDAVSLHLSCRITWLCTGPRTRLLQIFYHCKTKRRPTDSLRGTSVFVFQHVTVFGLEHDFAFSVTEDKLNYLAHHLLVQGFKIILPMMELAAIEQGFVMLVMSVNDNTMLGKWNSAVHCCQVCPVWWRAPLICAEFSPVFWRMP